MGVIKNISLRLAYDGTEFYGFQRQSSLPSVQQHVEGLCRRYSNM